MRRRKRFDCKFGQVMVTVSIRPCFGESEKNPDDWDAFDPWSLEQCPLTPERLRSIRLGLGRRKSR